MLGTFGGKAFESGVEDACQRLKRAAEARYRASLAAEQA